MLKTKQINMLVALLVIASMVLAACGAPAAAPEPADSGDAATTDSGGEAAAEAEAEPTEPAEEEAEAAMDGGGEIARNETVIFDNDSGRQPDPELWNMYVPGMSRSGGYHQAILEPLFILNYQTGEIEPWLGTEMTSNDTFDVWTLTLREGIEWADGEAMNAEDVVFTMNMLLENLDMNSAAGLAAFLDNVEQIDDLTVQFNLHTPNPRFQLDNFSVRIYGSISIMPEHMIQNKVGQWVLDHTRFLALHQPNLRMCVMTTGGVQNLAGKSYHSRSA